VKKLVLLGGGHAHVHVLKTLHDAPIADIEVTLITPYARQVYSGMLPGWVAGHYTIEQCVIPLPPLCAQANVNFRQTAGVRIDLTLRQVVCADGSLVGFDILSIDTGPVADLSMIPGADAHGIAVRPIEQFIDACTGVLNTVAARKRAGTGTHLAFVGAGAAGVELALSMQHAFTRLPGPGAVQVTLISAANTLPGSVGPRIARVMRERGLQVMPGQPASRIEAGRVHLQSGEVVNADHIIVSTGASAAPWLAMSGLACDARGFLVVNSMLQSTSHACVFAAGDCAGMAEHPRPKSGVFAVRAGPPLAENLRRALRGEALLPHVPQEKSLYLISTGDKYAIASWGDWAWQGRWVWWWKDRIDRAFMRKYSVQASRAK
jgi:pyridine nucleotide-disulfide oxidoreductase family protein